MGRHFRMKHLMKKTRNSEEEEADSIFAGWFDRLVLFKKPSSCLGEIIYL